MTVETKETGKKLEVKVRGRLDAMTLPDLEKLLTPKLPEIRELDFDFERLMYVSSAGLRMLLAFHKTMEQQGGKMVIRHINDIVGDVLEVTGFIDFLNVE